jgi:CHAD domain-containing protein
MSSFSKSLLSLYGDYAESITTNLDAAISSSSSDAFHDLRVGVKRMRALFQLVAPIDRDFPAREFSRDLRTLFRPAGAVRDLQVQLDLVAAVAASSPGVDIRDYTADLLDREQQALVRFAMHAALFDRKHLDKFRRGVRRSLRSIDQDVARIIAEASLNGDLRAIGGWETGRNLHELRIVAKRAHHSLFMMRQAFPAFAPTGTLVQRVDQLQKILGTWHDAEVAIQTHRLWEARCASGALRDESAKFSALLVVSKRDEETKAREALESTRPEVMPRTDV